MRLAQHGIPLAVSFLSGAPVGHRLVLENEYPPIYLLRGLLGIGIRILLHLKTTWPAL